MKFLHISDLHLGKILNDVSLLADQEYILNRIIEISEDEQTDAVLIAGDVYQRSNPSAEAMALFDRFISRLTTRGKKIFMISGNHDSSERISYFSSLIREAGVHTPEAFSGALHKETIPDEYGEIDIYLMPFLRPSDVKRFYPDWEIRSYQDAVRAVLESVEIDAERRSILVCHQFIAGSETSDSEEISVGTLDQISASLFSAFDYVALGHLHRPQFISVSKLRYAGSPLKYSFSEAANEKSATIVDVREKGNITVHTRPLTPLRDLRMVKGSLWDIMHMPPSPDYVWVTVTDEIVPPDAKLDITSVFPNMLRFSVSNSRTLQEADEIIQERLESKSVSELFLDFYKQLNGNQEPTEKHMDVFQKVLKRLEEKRHASD